MDFNNPLSSMPNMPQPFSGGLGNPDISTFDSYGVSNDFSIQLAKMQELIALQQQKQEKNDLQEDIAIYTADKIESKDNDDNNESDEKINLIDTPESIGFNTSIQSQIDYSHLEAVIDKFFEEFMETSFENFKRKTKSLLESLSRAMDTPFDKDNTHPNESPYNTIMHSVTTELRELHETVHFSDEEILSFSRSEFKARFDYVVMIFEPILPELKNEEFIIDSEDDSLLSLDSEES